MRNPRVQLTKLQNKKAIIADGLSVEYCEGAALSMGTLGFNLLNCKYKKAIIADSLSVEYCEGAAHSMRNPRVQLPKLQKQKSHHC